MAEVHPIAGPVWFKHVTGICGLGSVVKVDRVRNLSGDLIEPTRWLYTVRVNCYGEGGHVYHYFQCECWDTDVTQDEVRAKELGCV